MYFAVLLLHLLAATIWTGGHLVLALAILPRVLRERDVAALLAFEGAYEKIGMPALLVQVATGLWMAHTLLPSVAAWFDWSNPVARLISLKLALMLGTALIAVDARLRIIPKLSAATLPALARRISLVTLFAVGFVVVGSAFRSGWLA